MAIPSNQTGIYLKIRKNLHLHLNISVPLIFYLLASSVGPHNKRDEHGQSPLENEKQMSWEEMRNGIKKINRIRFF